VAEGRREMDYMKMLKDAFRVTWRYKVLWIFGLLGGTASSFWLNAPGGDYQDYGTVRYELSDQEGQEILDALREVGILPHTVQTFQDLVPLLIAIAVTILVIALLVTIVRIAAQGGLAHLTNEALREGEVRAGAGWRAGFSNWFRVFGIGFLLALPVVAVGLLAGAALVVMLVSVAGSSSEPVVPLILTALTLVPLLILLLSVAGVIVHMLREVAIRHAVLSNATVTDSIAMAWRSLWGRKGVFTTWLMLWLVSIGFGIVGLIAVAPSVIPIVVGIATQSWTLVALGALLAVLIGLLVGALQGTFNATVWTALYGRYITGTLPAGEADA